MRMPSSNPIMPLAALLTAVALVPAVAVVTGPKWRYVAAGDEAMDPKKLDAAIAHAVESQMAEVHKLAVGFGRAMPAEACNLNDYTNQNGVKVKVMNYFMSPARSYKFALSYYSGVLNYRVWKLHDDAAEPNVGKKMADKSVVAVVNMHILYWQMVKFCKIILNKDPAQDGVTLAILEAMKAPPNKLIGHHKFQLTANGQKVEVEADFEEDPSQEEHPMVVNNAKVKLVT